MPLNSQPLRRLSITLFSLIALALLAPPVGASDDDRPRKQRTMTGLWVTETASPFVIQYGDGPSKELTRMAWTLSQDEDGLITGFNTYLSGDLSNATGSAGALCMVGARIGSRVVISEAPVEAPTVPIFVFECEQRNNRKLTCLGHGLANLEPIALQATLLRQKDSIEAVDLVTDEILAICQPNP
ncbi:MAG: hypothetical protein P8Q97_03190 [Myxococcota bacterium]|jgi:hypothetical protein|nr:hypothetical protein [Myxococcota bacterium]